MKTRIKVAGIVLITLLLIMAVSTVSSSAHTQPETLTGTTERISVATDGTQSDSVSLYSSISGDGRYVAFDSNASNLVSGDTNLSYDVFVHDRQTGETTRVSVTNDGEQGLYGGSNHPSISADGRFVTFDSSAFNLVIGDTNGFADVFVHDRSTGETIRVSVASDGTQGDWESNFSAISADGRFVAFESYATNLVANDTNGSKDVFVHDLSTGQTTRISIGIDGTQGNAMASSPSISSDGRFVAFVSSSTNLVVGDTNNWWDVFVHDRQTGETSLVSVASDGTQANNYSGSPTISADGRLVAFASLASNLVDGDANQIDDIFVHDWVIHETIMVSITSDGMPGNSYSEYPCISADGHHVAFYSESSNLVYGDTNGASDIFVHDLMTHETSRISLASNGSQAYDDSSLPVISADGHFVAFSSIASTLVIEDTNEVDDIFVRDLEGVAIPGLDFRPYIDGYGFRNNSWGNQANFIESDVRRMFGDEAACSSFNPTCIITRQSMLWSTYADRSLFSGRSDGMASTSLRFFKSLDTHPGIDFTAMLGPEDEVLTTWQGETITTTVQRNIAFFSVEGLLPPVQGYKEQIRQDTPTQILTQTISVMSDGAPDPVTLFIRPTINSAGHTVTPYGYTNQGGGVFWIWVYDSEHPYDGSDPNDSNRYVIVDTNSDSWSYDLGWTTWSGDADSHTLGIVPISIYTQIPDCPWCETTLAAVNQAQLWLFGAGHLLATDSQGRRLGYSGSDYVSEIPSAHADFYDAGSQVTPEPIYTLPLTETYAILLDGQTLSQAAPASVAQFGPGYAVSVDYLDVFTATQDELTFANDGTQLVYHANQDQEPSATFALDSLSANYGLSIQGVDISAGQIITLSADMTAGELVLNGSHLSEGAYTLALRMVNSAGLFNFYHADIPILATDTHLIEFGAWNGSGTVTLEIDHGSDGYVDETVYLENQMKFFYLPYVRFNR